MKHYVFQLKLKEIDRPQTLISNAPNLDLKSIKGTIEWYRLIGVVDKND